MAEGPVATRVARLHARDLGAALRAILGASVGLLIPCWFVPGVDVGGVRSVVVAGVLVSVCGVVLRTLLLPVAARLGWVGAVLLGLGGQAVAIWLVVFVPAASESFEWWWAGLTAWIVGAGAPLLGWR